jgi:uncharacterized protein YneF (UPF0154 family)
MSLGKNMKMLVIVLVIVLILAGLYFGGFLSSLGI